MGISLGIIGYGSMGERHHKYAAQMRGVTVIGAYDADSARWVQGDKHCPYLRACWCAQ